MAESDNTSDRPVDLPAEVLADLQSLIADINEGPATPASDAGSPRAATSFSERTTESKPGRAASQPTTEVASRTVPAASPVKAKRRAGQDSSKASSGPKAKVARDTPQAEQKPQRRVARDTPQAEQKPQRRVARDTPQEKREPKPTTPRAPQEKQQPQPTTPRAPAPVASKSKQRSERQRDVLADVAPSDRLGDPDSTRRLDGAWLRYNWPFVLAGVFIALGVVLIVLVLTSNGA